MTWSKLELGIAGVLYLSFGCSRNEPLSTGAKGEACTAGGGCAPGLVCVFGSCAELPDHDPMKREGGVVLGTAGDNSNVGQGNFFEGVMTARYSSNVADDLVQANIVAAYGQ